MNNTSSSAVRRRLATAISSAIGTTTVALGCQGQVTVGGGGHGSGGQVNIAQGTASSSSSSSTVTSTGTLNPCAPAAGGDKTTACVPWPDPTTSTAVGSGTSGGVGGMSNAGGAGGAGNVPCPAPADAKFMFGACGVASVDGFGTYTNGTCCYPVTTACCSGRPFIVDERAVTAKVARGDDSWRSREAPRLDGLDARTRRALADAWLRDALLEHASIASFSRFALELLAVGAPSDLVDAAHAAASDEVAHARISFAMASAYAGTELGPGAFDFAGSVEVSSDLAVVAAKAVTEGCIGETLAAMQASEGLIDATDPVVRDALEIIARDESRHAQLAYRFVAWAVATGGDRVRAAVNEAFTRALEGPIAVPAGDELDLSAHGRARSALLRQSFEQTMVEVIGPAARTLSAVAQPS